MFLQYVMLKKINSIALMNDLNVLNPEKSLLYFKNKEPLSTFLIIDLNEGTDSESVFSSVSKKRLRVVFVVCFQQYARKS